MTKYVKPKYVTSYKEGESLPPVFYEGRYLDHAIIRIDTRTTEKGLATRFTTNRHATFVFYGVNAKPYFPRRVGEGRSIDWLKELDYPRLRDIAWSDIIPSPRSLPDNIIDPRPYFSVESEEERKEIILEEYAIPVLKNRYYETVLGLLPFNFQYSTLVTADPYSGKEIHHIVPSDPDFILKPGFPVLSKNSEMHHKDDGNDNIKPVKYRNINTGLIAEFPYQRRGRWSEVIPEYDATKGGFMRPPPRKIYRNRHYDMEWMQWELIDDRRHPGDPRS